MYGYTRATLNGARNWRARRRGRGGDGVHCAQIVEEQQRYLVSYGTAVSSYPEVAPRVGTAVRGGLTYREAHLAMELVAESGLLCCLEIVEVNPILGS